MCAMRALVSAQKSICVAEPFRHSVDGVDAMDLGSFMTAPGLEDEPHAEFDAGGFEGIAEFDKGATLRSELDAGAGSEFGDVVIGISDGGSSCKSLGSHDTVAGVEIIKIPDDNIFAVAISCDKASARRTVDMALGVDKLSDPVEDFWQHVSFRALMALDIFN